MKMPTHLIKATGVSKEVIAKSWKLQEIIAEAHEAKKPLAKALGLDPEAQSVTVVSEPDLQKFKHTIALIRATVMHDEALFNELGGDEPWLTNSLSNGAKLSRTVLKKARLSTEIKEAWTVTLCPAIQAELPKLPSTSKVLSSVTFGNVVQNVFSEISASKAEVVISVHPSDMLDAPNCEATRSCYSFQSDYSGGTVAYSRSPLVGVILTKDKNGMYLSRSWFFFLQDNFSEVTIAQPYGFISSAQSELAINYILTSLSDNAGWKSTPDWGRLDDFNSTYGVSSSSAARVFAGVDGIYKDTTDPCLLYNKAEGGTHIGSPFNVLPAKCLSCGTEINNKELCRDCARKLQSLRNAKACALCGNPATHDGVLCNECARTNDVCYFCKKPFPKGGKCTCAKSNAPIPVYCFACGSETTKDKCIKLNEDMYICDNCTNGQCASCKKKNVVTLQMNDTASTRLCVDCAVKYIGGSVSRSRVSEDYVKKQSEKYARKATAVDLASVRAKMVGKIKGS